MLISAIGNVNTRMTFDTIDGMPLELGWGISPFNASFANNVSTIAEELSQAGLATFLSDPSNAKDITSSELRAVPCAQSPYNQTDSKCERTFFMPGGVQLAAPRVDSKYKPLESNAFLAKLQRSYLLNFKEGEQSWEFKESDCQVYGFSFAAINLCLKNEGENTLQAS